VSRFDEVAAAAASGAAPIVIPVGADLATLTRLISWLLSAIPVYAPRAVAVMSPGDVDEALRSKPVSGTVLIIADAGAGDDETVKSRWEAWNAMRERFLDHVDFGRAGAFVFPVTATRVKDVVASAPHLMSVAVVLNVEELADPADDDLSLRDAYRSVVDDMESRYRLSSDELVNRLLSRESVPVAGHDLARWKAALEALRPDGE